MFTTNTPARRTLPAALAALGSLGALAYSVPAAAQAGDRGAMLDEPAITARLDIGGAGNFTGLIDTDKGQLCYMLNAPVAQPTRAVIADDAGKALVTLATPDAKGTSAGCMAIAPAAVQALTDDADDYALVIDTAIYPDGAVQARLHGMPSEAG